MKTKKVKTRNPVARSPLMRKGGVHTKSKTGQRMRHRLGMNEALDEWQETQDEAVEGAHDVPLFFVTLDGPRHPPYFHTTSH